MRDAGDVSKPQAALRSRVLLIPRDDIDTDQIIPVPFLGGHDEESMATGLFRNWRDSDPAFPLNAPDAPERRLLLVGRNFGCGSSREHAVWALKAFGFRAVIARGFADIFYENALSNALIPLKLRDDQHQALLARLNAAPSLLVEVDLVNNRLLISDGTAVAFEAIHAFRKRMLLRRQDDLTVLLGLKENCRDYVDSVRCHEEARARLGAGSGTS
jgi:3-isopropylmalate/(R)-2-methylmalate dehydratase small subunit